MARGDRYLMEGVPLLDINLDQIISNVPYTNVGMVRAGVFGDTGESAYVYPRDPRVQELLNYAPNPSNPEDPYAQRISFAPDAPTQIYNTELNPYNPSSEFFPYQQDASGIMAVESLSQPSLRQPEGIPIFDTSGTPEGEGVYGTQGTYSRRQLKSPRDLESIYRGRFDVPTGFNIGINVESLMKDKGYIDSTVLHEAKHLFDDKYGYNSFDRLTPEQKHKVIYMTQGMFYNQGIDKRRTGVLTSEEAMALMQAQAMGLAYLQNKMFPETKLSKIRGRELETGAEVVSTFDADSHIHSENINGTHSHNGSTHTHSDGGSTGNVSSGGSTGGGSTGGGTVVIGGQPGGRPSRDPVQERQRISDILEVRRRGANIGFKAGGLASINHLTRGL